MPKSSKPKKKQEADIHVGGNVIGDNIVIGSYNKITFQEVVKTTYGLFTIPQPVTDFTGREEELAQLKISFEKGAIITGLSGAGGIGKTELARKLAHEIADYFPDAQMNIDLLGTSEKPTSPEDVMRHLLEPFYVGQKLPDDETQLKGLYQQTFANKKILLLLDNAANAAQVRPLIPPAPSAAIITSRQHFSLTEFGMHEPLRLDLLSPENASELLRGASPKLNDASDPDGEVNQLAKLCGYLPLALRVAASLLNDRSDWTASHLIKRLTDERTRLQRLKREDDANLDVDATLNLSYGLLSGDLKKHFRTLGIFTAPFAKVSAQTVLEIKDEDELDDVLGKLIARSFLNSQKSHEIVENLYSLHDLTRLYAAQKLLEEKEYEETLGRHAKHFLQWASDADDLYQKGSKNILSGLAEFRFIWVHLHSSYERLLPVSPQIFPRPRMADRWLNDFPNKCIYVLDLHLLPHQKIEILENALNAEYRLGERKTEDAYLANLGNLYLKVGNAYKAVEHLERALTVSREIRSKQTEGAILGNLGNAYLALGEQEKAIYFLDKALASSIEFSDKRAEAAFLGNLGNAYLALKNEEKTIELYKKALIASREIGDRRIEGTNLCNLGGVYLTLGNTNKAIEYLEEALAVSHEIGDRQAEGGILSNLGNVQMNLGDINKAIEFYISAIDILHEIGDKSAEGISLGRLGNAYAKLGEKRKSIEFYESQLLIVREIGNRKSEEAVLGSLGAIHADLNEKNKAIAFYEQHVEITHEIGEQQKESALLGILGSMYADMGEMEKAIEAYESSLAIARKINNRQIETATLSNLKLIYKKANKIADVTEKENTATAVQLTKDNARIVRVATQAYLKDDDANVEFNEILIELSHDVNNGNFANSLQKIVYQGSRIEKKLTDLLDSKVHKQIIRDILKNIEQIHRH